MTDINFNELIDNYLEKKLWPKQVGRYWPSDSGGCLRKTWFSFRNPKPVDKQTARVFEAGNMLHEFVTDVIESDKNQHVELLDKELPVRISCEDFVVAGRIDDLVLVKLNNEKYLVEVKSCKYLPREVRKDNEMQLQLYMHSLGVHKGILLYVQKDNLQTAQFSVDYDEELVGLILGRFKRLHKHLTEGLIPKAEGRLIKDKNWMCNYCRYVDECKREGGY